MPTTLFVEFRWLWKKADGLDEVEPGTTIMVRNKDGILLPLASDDLPTERLLVGIAAGHVYVLWGQKVLRGEFVDEMIPA